jgi:hypothetical protein
MPLAAPVKLENCTKAKWVFAPPGAFAREAVLTVKI